MIIMIDTTIINPHAKIVIFGIGAIVAAFFICIVVLSIYKIVCK